MNNVPSQWKEMIKMRGVPGDITERFVVGLCMVYFLCIVLNNVFV